MILNDLANYLMIIFSSVLAFGVELSKFGSKYSTLFISLSLFLSISSWILSYLHKKFPSNFFKWLETISVVTGVMALLINLISSHLMVLSFKTDPMNIYTALFFPCLFAVQLNYLQRGFKISYVFITSVIALPITLLMFYYLSPLIRAEMPLYNYYGGYAMAIVIFGNNDGMMWIIKRQTWINRIQLLDRFMPTKNIGECILSSVASFCYSSLILCILLSRDSFSFVEYMILGWVSVSLLFNGVISFALLVKYEEAGNQVFPGCLFIYYIIQGYRRCKNLISGNIDPSPKFNWKNFFFAFLLIINGLGSTAFGVTSVTPEPVSLAANDPGTSSSVPAGSVVEESVRRVQVSPALGSVGLTAHDQASSSVAENQDSDNLLQVFIDPETNVLTFHDPAQSSGTENPNFNRLLQVSVDWDSGDLVAHEQGRPIAEGVKFSRAVGENVKWVGRGLYEGVKKAPEAAGQSIGTLPANIVSGLAAGIAISNMSADQQAPSTSNVESSQVNLAERVQTLEREKQEFAEQFQQERLERLELKEKYEKLEKQVNSSFLNRLFSCFKPTDSTAAKHAAPPSGPELERTTTPTADQSGTQSDSAEPRS